MALMVGTIFKWHETSECGEECEDGICVGIITDTVEPGEMYKEDEKDKVNETGKPLFMVKWYELCDKHAEIDPDGTGPYRSDILWEIGYLY